MNDRQDELRWTGRFMGGLRDDIARRWPHYASDFRDGLHPKVAGSTLFLFFACLANAIAFGALTGVLTQNQIGIVEMLVITSVGGIAFALFAGQPLTLLGGTGPVTIFTGLLYASCAQSNVSFLAAYAWVGIWSGLMLIVCALTDASALMRYFNRFTDEIFAGLISIIFIYEALKDIAQSYAGSDLSKAFLSTILALGTFMVARNLKLATRWPYLNRTVREFLSDFGPALAIAALTLFSMQFPEVQLDRPAVPQVLGTTSGRPWLVPLGDLSVPAILACSIPAAMVTILLFLDQNITVRIVNAKDNGLRKGSGYHLDLLVVGILVVGASLFALPWIVAATVHSVNHVKSLTESHVENKAEVVDSVLENRISPLAIHLLIGISVFWLSLIAQIPMAVLFGLFLYMGISSLGGNQFWERLLLWITDSRLYPDTHYTRHIPAATIHKFTLIQLVCLVALWLVKSSRLGIVFPLMIAALVPVYMLISRYFEAHHAELLAAEDQEEVVAMHCN
ncbi:MAG: HCO3- transporter [Candidatus Eremiobacteraeota bacterium]|nr:HCO3- transporter [Candidatus Eremiobacteraeota bacterium]MCW5870559.1 HCO3- transporter [Candidatus Eremiobacteraeota bacterium]